MDGKYFVGFLYILYGITKVIIGLSVMTIPVNIIKKIPVLNWFIKTISDKTVAGRFYEYVLLIFGFYTIIHALALFEVFSDNINVFLDQKVVLYNVFMIFGIVLTVFYCLVLYTNLPIEKDPKQYDDYKLFGLGGGISFIVFPILWEIIDRSIPFFRGLPSEVQKLAMFSGVIILLFSIDLIYNYINRKKIEISAKQLIPRDYQNAYGHVEDLTKKIKPVKNSNGGDSGSQ